MADLLADMKFHQRFRSRTQAAFMRGQKFLNLGRSASDNFSSFNIRHLLRLHDMNPQVFTTAIALLEEGVEEDPAKIRETKQFRNLIDNLGLQPSGKTHDARNTHKASLILLEVFTYMVIIHRAKKEDEEDKEATKSAMSQSYEDELTA